MLHKVRSEEPPQEEPADLLAESFPEGAGAGVDDAAPTTSRDSASLSSSFICCLFQYAVSSPSVSEEPPRPALLDAAVSACGGGCKTGLLLNVLECYG